MSLKQVTAFVLVVAALYFAYEATKMRILLAIGPGPGFFPLVFAIVLGVVAVLYLLEDEPVDPEPAETSTTGPSRLLIVLMGLVSVVVLIEPLGFRLTMLGLYVLVLTTLGVRNLPMIAITALVGSFGLYYAFVELLRVQLPAGLLGL